MQRDARISAGIKSARHGNATYILKKIGIRILPMLAALSCIVPIVWLFLSSFKTTAEFESSAMALPRALNLDNYLYIFRNTEMPLYIFNTFRNTMIAMVFILFFGYINGYFFGRVKFRFSRVLFGFYMCNLFIPIHALLVPTYILFSAAGIVNRWFSTIPAMVCMELTTTIFLISSYVKTIPKEIEEAAAIDGSSFSRTLFRIIMPLTTPVLITAGIIAFFHCWNEFSYSLVLLNDDKIMTVPLSLTRFKSESRIDYPRMMAAMMTAISPALLAYILFSKQIIKGMIAGSVKG